MAEHDPHSSAPGNVPGLIDQYRERHRAWLAQADELVRLRDEVRLAAEREALEIITAARRDVRRIIVEARRELLVLTAQLHAAVDAVDQSAAMPPPGPAMALTAAPQAVLEAPLSVTQDLVRGARREVRAVLDEARAEIEALAAETPPTFPPAPREPGPSPWEAGAPPTFSGPFPVTPAPQPVVTTVAPPAESREPVQAASVAEVQPAQPIEQIEIGAPAEAAVAGVAAEPAPPAALAPPTDGASPLQEPWVPESWLHELTGNEPDASKAPSLDLHVPEVVLSETASPESVASQLMASDVAIPAKPVVPIAPAPDLDSAAAALGAVSANVTASQPPSSATPEAVHIEMSSADVASLWADSTDRMEAAEKPALAPVRFEWRQATPREPATASTDAASLSAGTTTAVPAAADQPPTSGLFETHAEHSQQLSRVFASSGAADGNAARVPARTFVGLFAGAGLVVLMGTLWWMNSRTSALPETTTTEQVPAPVAAPSAVSPVADDATPARESDRSLSLTIEARRASWIRASIDGQDEAGRLYQAGETRQIVGAKTVAVRAGDAGAVFVSVNGAPAQALGTDGNATTRRFDVAELPGAASATPAIASATDAVPATAARATLPTPRTLPAVEATAALPAAARADARPASPAATPANASARPGSEASLAGGRPDLLGAGQQWLDAYQRRDREGMGIAAAENINITDERSVAERFPAAQNSVRRDLDQVELELTGDTALLTARMTERGDGSAAAAPYISRISQIWVRRGGQWRLADVRIIGEARLSQIVR